MPTTERIIDWAALTDAGIDTDRVERETNSQDTSLELYRLTSRDGGQLSYLFGESTDPDADGGWDAMEYERTEDGDWTPTGSSPDFFEDPAELLAAVHAWAEGN